MTHPLPHPNGAAPDVVDILGNCHLFDRPAMLKPPYYWVEHIPFANFVVNSLQPQTIVELGVHSGNSFNAFCHAVQAAGLGTRCFGIDTWKGDEHTGPYDEAIYAALLDNVQSSYRDFASLLRMSFDDGLSRFSAGSIDLLHIDGFHAYESVKRDFENWLPKMSDAGVVILHDIAVRGGDFGVWRLWEEISGAYPSLAFNHGSGLGVVAVGPRVPPRFLDALRVIDTSPFYRQMFARLGSNILLQEENRNLEAELSLRIGTKQVAREHCCSLYVDTGSGLHETQKLLRRFREDETTVEFDISQYEDIRQVLVRLEEEMTAVRIGEISVHCKGGGVLQIRDYQTNAVSAEDSTYLFLTNDPQVVFPIDGDDKPLKMLIRLHYLAVGQETFSHVFARIQLLLQQKQRSAGATRATREWRRLAASVKGLTARFLKAAPK